MNEVRGFHNKNEIFFNEITYTSNWQKLVNDFKNITIWPTICVCTCYLVDFCTQFGIYKLIIIIMNYSQKLEMHFITTF